MSSYRVKLRRGTTAETSVFTGEVGEVTVDTTKKTLVVHDGATRGGHPLPRDTDVKTDLNQLTDNYGLLQSYVDGFTGSTEVYAITVAPDSSGNNNVFYITGLENPHIVLTPGNRYVFDVSDSSNTGHPLYFTADDGVTNYTTNVSRIGTEGTAGAKVIFIIPADVPALKYYCSVHGLSMGNQISSVLNTQSSGGGSSSLASFDISPALPTGETSWNLATDGDLSITEAGNWTFTATADGTIDLSMKGAGGGYGKDTNALGGTGGLTSGKIAVSAGDVFKVTVGSKGVQSGGAGAYGGGGAGGNLTLPGSGGGYSGIFEGNEQQSKSILIAGGGGGGHGWDAGSATGNGGSGGGSDGLAGTAGSSGGGATQISGGAGAGNGTSGTPLTGGTGGTRSTNQGSGGGGGGGYFGGGGGAAGTYNGNQNGTPGGGGSGYIGGTSNFAVTDGVTTAGSGSTTEVDGTFSMVGQVATTEETPTVTTPTVIIDSYETIFHLTTDGAAGVNTEFADSSSTAATVTAGGTPQLNTFSPYRHGGYSTYFDGTGDYITIPNNSGTPFDFGTDNFTIEGWFYLTTSGSWTSYWGISQGGGPAQKINLYDSAGDGTLDIDVDGSVVFSSSAVLTDLQNKWAHIALVREGTGTNQTKLYVNGSVVGQGTVSTNFSGFTQPFTIGHNGEIYSGAFNGYISDFRIVSSAVYTADFTPPTERLTAIAGTELLTCHLPYIVDESTNNNTITINGNTKTEPFSPYDHIGYIEGTHGGSVYFDGGTNDYLKVGRLFDGATVNTFTIECWINYSNATSYNYNGHDIPGLFSDSMNISTGESSGPMFGTNPSDQLVLYWWSGSPNTCTSTETIDKNTWTHIAAVCDNNSIQFYINGVAATMNGTTTWSGTSQTLPDCHIGGNYHGNVTGYISDFRVTSTAVYTADFTPPTAPLESTGAELHIKGSEGHIIDKSQSDNKLTLVGDVTASAAESKYAGSSIYFDGYGDYITLSPEDSFQFGTEDFTVELWVNYTNSTSASFFFVDARNSSQTTNWAFYRTSGTELSWYNGTSEIKVSNFNTPATWTHIAYTRSGTTGKLFINGVQSASGTDNTNYSVAPSLSYIGTRYSLDERLIGHMEDFRITKGLARYTENFTVPSESLDLYTETSGTTEETPTTPTTYNILSNSSNTGLLITTDGEAGVNSSFVDSSSNAATITAGGTPQLNTFSPYRHGGYSMYSTSTNHIEKTGLTAPGTGDFTIEAWVYVTESSANQLIWDTRPIATDNTTGINVQFRSNNVLYAGSYQVGYITGTTTFNDNEWVHVALVRSGGTLTLYGNGVSQGSVAHSVNLTSTDINIGSNRSGASVFNGYIRDLRVVNSAVYSADFTPPTETLTSVTDTVLLTCNTPHITETISGTVTTEPFSPYDHIGYIEGTHGGSVYFDGTEWLQIAHNSIYDIYGSANGFTVEGWIYPEQWANTEYGDGIVCKNTGSAGWIVRIGQDGKLQFVHPSLAGSGPLGVPCPINTWTHFAFTRTSTGDWNLYQNGVNTETFSLSGTTNRDNNEPIYIGREVSQSSAYFKGYISDVKISNTVVYSTDFDAPTSVIDSTDSLLHIKGSEGHIIDKSQSGNNFTLVGDVTASAAESKYAGSSISLDGNGDHIQLENTPDIDVSTGDFTWEGWFNWNDISNNPKIFISGASATTYWQLYVYSSKLTLRVNSSQIVYGVDTANISTNQWYHIALVRSGDTFTVYKDGVAVITDTYAGSIGHHSDNGIGGQNSYPASSINGYMEDVRLTKGLARYTENFTVPDAALESPQTTGGGSYTVATGGTITTDGNYKYHTFTGDGTFSVTSLGTNTTIDVLAVGGGGAGGGSYDSNAGGGGAGGYLEGSITAEVQSYDIVIGQGGTGASQALGTNGGDTTISVLNATALGGGYGGGGARATHAAGASGGSGGGGAGFPSDAAGGAALQGDSGGLTGYGNAGGSIGSYSSDGGGGAGQTGGTNANSAGGDGRQWLDGNYYAGGGSGGAGGLAGGLGGGGAGSNGSGNGGNATANTGGGGGGAYANPGPTTGGNGGSGVVIFRYPYQGAVTETAPTSTSTSYRYMKVVLNSVSSGTQAQVTEISFTGENGATDFITGQTITNWYGTGSTATSQSPTIALVNNAQSPQNSEHTNLETLPFTLEYDLGASYVHGTELKYLQLGSSDSPGRYPTSVTVYGATQPDFTDEVALITNSAQAYASVNSNTLIDLGTSITETPPASTPGDWNFDEAAGTDINSYSTWSAFSLPQLSGSPSWTFNGSALVVDLGGEYDVGISTPMNVTSGTTYTITINLSQNSVSRSGIMIGTSAGDQTYANALGGEITSSGEHVRTWTATTTGTVYFLYRSVAANVTSGTMTIDNITISPWE